MRRKRKCCKEKFAVQGLILVRKLKVLSIGRRKGSDDEMTEGNDKEQDVRVTKSLAETLCSLTPNIIKEILQVFILSII